MIKKIFLTYTFLFLSHVAFSMQEVEKVKIFSPSEIVFNLITSHYLYHKDICSFAETTKYNHQFIVETAGIRKRKIATCPQHVKTFGNFVHKYGSATYYVYQVYTSTGLSLCYDELGEKDNYKAHDFTEFISPLPHNPKPFFDGGKLCFYGYGRYKITDKHDNSLSQRGVVGILQYNLNDSTRLCAIRVEDKEEFPLSYFLSYPFLLKALLNVSGIDKTREMGYYSSSVRIYSIDDAMIPDNHQERVDFCSHPCTLFKNFPQRLKNAIEKRYKECVEQKMMK